MGYNVLFACHTHRERAWALRGEEAKIVALWARRHPRSCQKELRVDNGWSSPDEFPEEYVDVYDVLVAE